VAIKNPHELFLQELAATYYSERTILKGMQEMQKLAQSDRVKQMVSDHISDSQKQVKDLEQCFSELGERPREARCFVADGFLEDFKMTAKEIQDPSLIDFVILGAMDKVEHFEIAVYRGLFSKAKLMGHISVAQILSQIGRQEQSEAQLIESAEQDLAKTLIGKMPPGGPSTRPRMGL